MGLTGSESLLDALFFVCCTIKAAACLARERFIRRFIRSTHVERGLGRQWRTWSAISWDSV